MGHVSTLDLVPNSTSALHASFSIEPETAQTQHKVIFPIKRNSRQGGNASGKRAEAFNQWNNVLVAFSLYLFSFISRLPGSISCCQHHCIIPISVNF